MDSILVVDAALESRQRIETLLAADGYHVVGVDSLGWAFERIQSEQFHLILVNSVLDAGPLEQAAGAPVLRFLTGAATSDDSGAAAVLPGPLRQQITHAISRVRGEQERQALREELRDGYGSLVARAPSMVAVLDQIRNYAALSTPVWICGEAGTGKHSLALLLHSWSSRASGPFVPLSAGGHPERRMAAADGGTLYVRELDLLDAAGQDALLKLIQEGSFREPSSGRLVRAGVRVVVASSGPLDGKVRVNALRADLLGCLLPCAVEVPPLRDRRQDIAPLAEHFLERAARRLQRPVPRLAAAAVDALSGHDWPGNAVELEAVMTRAALAAGECVEVSHLALEGPQAPLRLAVLERGAIEKALQLTGDNRTRAARLLGISVRTLQYRLKEYGIKWEASPKGPGNQS